MKLHLPFIQNYFHSQAWYFRIVILGALSTASVYLLAYIGWAAFTLNTVLAAAFLLKGVAFLLDASMRAEYLENAKATLEWLLPYGLFIRRPAGSKTFSPLEEMRWRTLWMAAAGFMLLNPVLWMPVYVGLLIAHFRKKLSDYAEIFVGLGVTGVWNLGFGPLLEWAPYSLLPAITVSSYPILNAALIGIAAAALGKLAHLIIDKVLEKTGYLPRFRVEASYDLTIMADNGLMRFSANGKDGKATVSSHFEGSASSKSTPTSMVEFFQSLANGENNMRVHTPYEVNQTVEWINARGTSESSTGSPLHTLTITMTKSDEGVTLGKNLFRWEDFSKAPTLQKLSEALGIKGLIIGLDDPSRAPTINAVNQALRQEIKAKVMPEKAAEARPIIHSRIQELESEPATDLDRVPNTGARASL